MFALCIITALIIGCVVYFNYNPVESVFFPKCPFLMLTGLKCPGCGSQRAIHALLHWNIRSAFHHNALLIMSIPYILLLLVAKITYTALRRGQEEVSISRFSHFAVTIQHPVIIWSYCSIVLIFWITRNIYGF